jgi:thiopeptide-type bacteriocin biosynthesis protein
VHDLKVKKIIGNYVILPYDQETHRYGGIELMEFAETIFDLDTKDLLSTIIEKDLSVDSIRKISILKIKNYLEFFGYSIDEMIEYCENCIVNFSKEFELNSQLRKELNKEFSEIKFKISTYEYVSFLNDNLLKNNLLAQLEKSNYHLKSYSWLIIHMSMNRHFKDKQRYNEFKSYYFTKCYLNQIKFKKQIVKPEFVC